MYFLFYFYAPVRTRKKGTERVLTHKEKKLKNNKRNRNTDTRLNCTQLKLTAIKECFSECDVLTCRALSQISICGFFFCSFSCAAKLADMVACDNITSRRIERQSHVCASPRSIVPAQCVPWDFTFLQGCLGNL